MFRALVAKTAVALLVGTLAIPASAADVAEDDFAGIVASLVDQLTAAESVVQAEIDVIDRCVDDPECYVFGGAGAAIAIATRGQAEWNARLLLDPAFASALTGLTEEGWSKYAPRRFTQSPKKKRRLLRGVHLNLVNERADLVAMRALLAEELASLPSQETSDAPVTEPPVDGDGAGPNLPEGDGAEGTSSAVLRDFGIDPDRIAWGDDIGVAVICSIISTENGNEIARPKFRAPSREEIAETIAKLPNGCQPTATRNTQLIIELTRIGDPAPFATKPGAIMEGG